MKVLNLMGMNSTKFGGIEKFNIEMAKQGVDVSLVYNSIPLSDEYKRLIELHQIPLYSCSGSNLISLLKIIVKEEPDIIHYHFSGAIYYLICILLRVFFPRIKQIHTVHCEPIKNHGCRRLLAKLFYRSLDQIVAVSLGVCEGFNKLYGENYNIVVSYLGVNSTPVKNAHLKAHLNIQHNSLVITTIGWDIHIKGYDLLLQAMACLNEEGINDNVVLIVVGLPKEEEKSLKTLITQYHLEGRCLSVGIREDIDDFLNITDIYVQPSRSEAISLSIMEALQHGIPIIGSNTGGIPEVCVDKYNGLIFEKENVEALCCQLKRLVLSAELRKQFGANSYELSKKYSRSQRAQSLKQIYERVLMGPI